MRIAEAHNKTELIAALDLERRYRMELRRGQETIWWNNILLASGDHYAQWNAARNVVVGSTPTSLRADDAHKVRLVLNHAKVVARTELAKLIKTRPIMEVVANSDEGDDVAAAQVGKKVLESLEWKFKLRGLRKKAAWWTVLTGLSAVGVFWDPDNIEDGWHEFIINPGTGEAEFDPALQEAIMAAWETGELEKEPIEYQPMGDIKYTLYSPFQLLPDPTALWWEDIRDLITIEIMHIDRAEAMFGKSVSELGPDEVTLGTMERRALARAGLSNWRSQAVKDAMYIYTYWLEPQVYTQNSYLKEGVCVRWCKATTELEFIKPFPYIDERGRGKLPFAYFEHIPSETSIWPSTVLTDIRGPNLELDKTASQLIENKDHLCNPMWRRAAQHRIQKPIRNVAGGEVVYQHVPNVPPPEPVPGLPLPSQVENILVYLRDQILDISGQGETSRGRVPSGVRAGVMIAYLQEEDETKLAPTIENLEDFVAKLGSLSLQRIQQGYEGERLLKYFRPDGIFEAFKFKRADLQNNTDVIAVAGSALPKMKAARQQFILDMVQLGVETDPKRVRDLLEVGGAEPDEVDMARSQAHRENVQLFMGEGAALQEVPTEAVDPETGMPMPPIVTIIPLHWHNDEAHLKSHYTFMSSADYERAVADDPTIGDRFNQHTGMHEFNKMMKLQQQMMMLMGQKGAATPGDMGMQMTSGVGAEGQQPSNGGM